MVAVAEQDVRLRIEVRGAVAELWRGRPSGEWMIDGPAGTGKTRGVLEFIHEECQSRKIRVLIIRKTLESLKTSVMVTFQEQVLAQFDGKRSTLDGVSYFGGNSLRPSEFTYQATGSKIAMAGMDNPSKVLSTEWDIIYVNEGTELTLNDWEMLTGRTDRPTLDADREPGLILGDCNPGPPSHWIKMRADEGRLRLRSSKHEDNPAMWDRKTKQWTASGQRYLDRLDQLTGVRYLRLRKGQWVAAEGQVYEDWLDGTHLIDRRELPALWDRIWTLDWGYTNPLVWGCWAIDHDGRMFLEHEIYHTRWLVNDVAQMIMSFWGNRREPVAIVADHDAEDRATFEKATGMATIGAYKDISRGIQMVQSRLRVQPDGHPRLQIMRDTLIHRPDESLKAAGKPTCTAQEFSTYVWPDGKGKTESEVPVKKDDHGMDMTRYTAAHLDKNSWNFDEYGDQLADAFSELGLL